VNCFMSYVKVMGEGENGLGWVRVPYTPASDLFNSA